jgi:hypothetical protein
MKEFGSVIPSLTLSYVGGDGDGGAPNLLRKAVALMDRE